MLVLSRVRNEKIVIPVKLLDPAGNPVEAELEIMVVEVRGEKVRLGVEAPHFVPVHREEVWEAIKRERRKQ
jgi:carbon storage regulator